MICFSYHKKILSMCFDQNNDLHKTKLDSCALEYIFLVYSRTQKGYHYYCPSLNRFLLSTDVKFFESKFRVDSESFSLKFENENIFFLVQDPLVMHIPSSVDIVWVHYHMYMEN